MKTYSIRLPPKCDIGVDVEIHQKTKKNEKPKYCDGCGKRVKKRMYYTESDVGNVYCLGCLW